MYNPYSLEGKTVLVTGASSGIGRATAIECSKLGAKVIITARNEERLNETLRMLDGDDHQIVVCDLSNTDEITNMVATLPNIDGVVNNAGFTKLAPIKFMKEEDLQNLLQINSIAPILLLQKLLKKRKIKDGASIVFTGSVDGLGFSTPGNAMYTASKGAICSFIKTAAQELGRNQIRVNAVCPGMVNTNILAGSAISEDDIELDKQNYPLGRYGEPRDIALAIIYLLSDASSWVTGTNLVIDGGLTTK